MVAEVLGVVGGVDQEVVAIGDLLRDFFLVLVWVLKSAVAASCR